MHILNLISWPLTFCLGVLYCYGVELQSWVQALSVAHLSSDLLAFEFLPCSGLVWWRASVVDEILSWLPRGGSRRPLACALLIWFTWRTDSFHFEVNAWLTTRQHALSRYCFHTNQFTVWHICSLPCSHSPSSPQPSGLQTRSFTFHYSLLSSGI